MFRLNRASGWKCARCSATNEESAFACTTCGLLRGAVVPTPSESAPQETPPPPAAPASTWSVASSEPATATPDATPASTITSGLAFESPPAAALPLWRRIPLGLVAFVVIAVGSSAVGWYFNAGRGAAGEITKSGDLMASDLRVGDCFDLKDPTAEEVGDVAARVCTEEHKYEMFYVGALPEGDYPAESAFDSFIGAQCAPAFATFVGKSYEESRLDISYFIPTAESWRTGDRTVQCAVYDPGTARLTASLKETKR